MHEKATPIRYGFFKKISAWFGSNPVVIFTMGKVGSSTIAVSLRELGIKEVQPHSLQFVRKGSYFVYPNLSDREERYYRIRSSLLKIKSFFFKIYSCLLKRKIRIISVYRDPVARNISAFFEQYQYVTDRNLDELEVEAIIDLFWKYGNHEVPLTWFDREIKKTFGINIFDYEFDRARGVGLIKSRNVELLLLSMEKMELNQGEIREFLGVGGFKLIPTNRASKKVYSEIYSDFKNNLSIPSEYLDKLYDSDATKYFYTKSDIEGFRRKWESV